MGEPAKKRATYQDILDAPEHMVAEIIDGELSLSPRPAGPHTAAASALGEELGPPFKRGRGGPGGWIILDEPEVHFASTDILVPDLAGWRRDRMAHIPAAAYFTVVPDWVCEVISPSSSRHDRLKKARIYGAAGVTHMWLVDPIFRMLEVMRWSNGHWAIISNHADDDKVRAEPFDAIELDLAILWQDVSPIDRPK